MVLERLLSPKIIIWERVSGISQLFLSLWIVKLGPETFDLLVDLVLGGQAVLEVSRGSDVGESKGGIDEEVDDGEKIGEEADEDLGELGEDKDGLMDPLEGPGLGCSVDSISSTIVDWFTRELLRSHGDSGG